MAKHSHELSLYSWLRVELLDAPGAPFDQLVCRGRVALNLRRVAGLEHAGRALDPLLRLPGPVRLGAPAPNPARHYARVSFAVKKARETSPTLYTFLGQTGATLYRWTPTPADVQIVDLPATDVASGVYVLHLRTGDQIKTRRLTTVQ